MPFETYVNKIRPYSPNSDFKPRILRREKSLNYDFKQDSKNSF